MRNIENTKFHSKKIGEIAKGCSYCVKGEKLVLFVTGLCSRNCWYCPLAETKKGKDVVFANEWFNPNDEEIIEEAKLCESKGAGITGGDPFLRIERAVHYIRMLKNKFGRNFHIHLYAPLEHVDETKLKMLFEAGLDEIRIHPNFCSDENWKKAELFMQFNWDLGMEIPVIPGMEKETKEMIDFFSNKIQFLNLNELESSDMNIGDMLVKGLKTKDELSYAIKGSEEMAIGLMKYILEKSYSFNVHYCTAKLKDGIQLANRIKKRAKNVAEKFDEITKEGMLLRGVVYLEELKPGFGYRKILEKINPEERQKIILKLKKIEGELINKFKINKSLFKIDDRKLRIVIRKNNIEKIINKDKNFFKNNNLIPAVVEEYPTWDATEVDINFI